MTPIRPPRAIVPGTAAHRLIRGVLKVRARTPYIARIDLVRAGEWSASILDSGDGMSWTTKGDTTLHMLWQLEEPGAGIDVGDTRHPIAPGDSMSVPAGTPLSIPGGMLFARIESVSASLDRVIPPHHGDESFEGYNRRTDYQTPESLSLQRWKITQPLTLPASPRPFAIVDLATPLALLWRGGADLIGRGETRIVPPGTGPVTLLPDGLGYALVIT